MLIQTGASCEHANEGRRFLSEYSDDPQLSFPYPPFRPPPPPRLILVS